MFSSLELPIVPIVTLLIMIPLVGWQIYIYWKNKARNKKPSVPPIGSQLSNDRIKPPVRNATLLNTFKQKAKISKKTSWLFTSAITIFVVINVLILTFYLNNQKISYLPRASSSISPTTINLDPLVTTPTIIPTKPISPSPLPTLLAKTNPSPTQATTPTSLPQTRTTILPSPSPLPTHAPTLRPTTAPTLIAKAFISPTTQPTTKITQATGFEPETIPATGVSLSSVVLVIISLTFLTLGFVL